VGLIVGVVNGLLIGKRRASAVIVTLAVNIVLIGMVEYFANGKRPGDVPTYFRDLFNVQPWQLSTLPPPVPHRALSTAPRSGSQSTAFPCPGPAALLPETSDRFRYQDIAFNLLLKSRFVMSIIPDLDPDLLRAFVAVADTRSFTRAAITLHRTQSAVSMQIKRLEDRLGVELFHRTKAQVGLSPSGEGLLGYARRILLLNEEAIGHLREQKIEGFVRLGVMDDYGSLVVPPLLSNFASGYPRINVEMETGLTSHMLTRLGAAFDLVVAMHPVGKGGGTFLRREQAVWATSALHPVEQTDPLPVALYPQGCLFRQWATDALDGTHRRWRLAFVSHSLAAVESIADQGLAVTVVKSGTFPKKLRLLSEREGMPRLPAADICLHRAPNLSRAASLLAELLVGGIERPVLSLVSPRL
jgi:DNA-binding transcriptional LysR family regulator